MWWDRISQILLHHPFFLWLFPWTRKITLTKWLWHKSPILCSHGPFKSRSLSSIFVLPSMAGLQCFHTDNSDIWSLCSNFTLRLAGIVTWGHISHNGIAKPLQTPVYLSHSINIIPVKSVASIKLQSNVRINNTDKLLSLLVSQFTDLSNRDSNHLYFMVVVRIKCVKYLSHLQHLTHKKF